MGTIRFELRKDKVDKSGLSPIQLIYQVSSQRSKYNSGVKALPQYWDLSEQCLKFLDKKALKKLKEPIPASQILTAIEIDERNEELTRLKQLILSIEKRFELDNTPYSSSMVIDQLKKKDSPTTKKDETSLFLYNFIDQYITDHQSVREKGSLKIYGTLKNKLQDYQIATKSRISFETLDYSFFESFQRFLLTKTKRPLNNTTVAKILSTVKTFLSYARKRGIRINDSYKDFKIKKETLEVIALTSSELEKLLKLDLSANKRLDQVRDVFCFGCATGLRYSDLFQLKWEHIKDDQIIITVKKTKERLTIPLNPISFSILNKYNGRHKPLPVISNQKMNQYLKGWAEGENDDQKMFQGLCEMAGIIEPIEIVRFKGAKRESKIVPKYKLIGVHTARKTFATLSLEKGMSAEEVMTITGHKDYKSFSRYVNVTEERKKVVMKKAWGEIYNLNLKAV